MNQTRTVLGLIIMVFLAIPVLFGIIWAVGLTQAVVSQKTLTELPGEIIAEVPDLLDGMVLAARDESSDLDYDSRTWLAAMDGISPTPRELMKETGINDWLEKELSGSLRNLGNILNGKTAARDIRLDMRPLKAAFNHPTMERWLSQVMEKLPPCSESQARDWERFMLRDNRYDSLPPCRPAAGQEAAAISLIRSHVTRDIPDQVRFIGKHPFPTPAVQHCQNRDLVHVPFISDPGSLHRFGCTGRCPQQARFLALERCRHHDRRRTGVGDVLPSQRGHPLGHAHRSGKLFLFLDALAGCFFRPYGRPGPGSFTPFHFTGHHRGRDRLRGRASPVCFFLHFQQGNNNHTTSPDSTSGSLKNAK